MTNTILIYSAFLIINNAITSYTPTDYSSDSAEIVYPKLYTSVNRVKRDTAAHANLTVIELASWILEYKEEKNRLHENYTVSWVDDTVTSTQTRPNCIFLIGQIHGIESRSAVTLCDNQITGFVKVNARVHFVQPLNESTDAHLLFVSDLLQRRTKRSIGSVCFTTEFSKLKEDEDSSDRNKVIELGDDEVEGNGADDDEFTHKGSTLNKWRREDIDDEIGYFYDSAWETNVFRKKTQGKINAPRRWLEIAIGIDYSVINFHGKNKVQHYVLALMNIVNAIYQDPTLDSNLQLVLTRMVLYEHRKHGQVRQGQARKSLENVNAWNKKLHFTLLPGEPRHDAAIWLTRIDIGGPSGYAPVSGACDPSRSCTLNRDEGLTSAFIIAHELAHILGLSHDGDDKAGNSCVQEALDGSIMAAMVATTFNKFSWSTCSKKEFHRRAFQWTCLLNAPRGLGEVVLKTTLHTTFSMDEQCRMEFGDGYEFCRGLQVIEPCSHLWCSHKDTPFICKTKKGPPLEGTECGTGKWCMNGYCELVDKYKYSLDPVLHNPQDGGWSNWTDWGPCSRTCGFGAQFRSRECNNPSPAYGGMNCKGSPEEFQICGLESCQEPLVDIRAEQCIRLPRIIEIKDANKRHMTWLPYESDKNNLKCQLSCLSRQSGEVFVSDESLLDGTPCSYDKPSDICIQGVCQQLGCDGKIGSTLQIDSCGVCSGNNTTCKNVTSIFHRNIKREISRVGVLPRLSRNILIICNITTIRNNMDNTISFMVRERYRGVRYNLTLPNGKLQNVRITKGTKFHYSKQNNILRIWGKGPLLEELIVLLYASSSAVNSGIGMSVMFSYVLPKGNVQEMSRYQWTMGGWGPCSASCGGGKRQRTVACRDTLTGKIVLRRHCSLTEKPSIASEQCNTFSCKFHWVAGSWEHCTTTCGANGLQSRELYCVHYSVNANNSNVTTKTTRSLELWKESVRPDRCPKEQPESQKSCNRVPCLAHWEPTEWSECSASCGVGYKSRDHHCPPPPNEPVYTCAHKPAEQRQTCRQYTSRSNPLCKGHKRKVCAADHSHICELIDYLSRYCVLPEFRTICCKTCRRIKRTSL